MDSTASRVFRFVARTARRWECIAQKMRESAPPQYIRTLSINYLFVEFRHKGPWRNGRHRGRISIGLDAIERINIRINWMLNAFYLYIFFFIHFLRDQERIHSVRSASVQHVHVRYANGAHFVLISLTTVRGLSRRRIRQGSNNAPHKKN